MQTVNWYFDYISPFAYFAQKRLQELPSNTTVKPIPILFAGLLNHFDTKGPAEIERMRQFTYRHTVWIAKQLEVPFTFPPAHPFNPLKLLRLTILLKNDIHAIEKIFDFVWQQGKSSDSPDDWATLCEDLGLSNADEAIANTDVKQTLIDNTQQAAELGVFGVPTFVVENELFFGQDSMAFLQAFLQDPNIFQSPEMAKVDSLPLGMTRKL